MKRLSTRSVFSRFGLMAIIVASVVLIATMAQAETDKYRIVWNDDPSTIMTIGWYSSI